MVRNSKTENVHRALARYIRPRLRRGADVEFTSCFAGIDDSNVEQHISQIAAAAMRMSAGSLVYDGNPHELHKAMRAATNDDGSTKEASSEVDENIIDRVLMLLESRLTPSELQAVRDILRKPAKKAGGLNLVGEDARNARLAFDAYAKRFPSAARTRIEPALKPEQPPAAAASSDYATRFPSAMRIGLA